MEPILLTTIISCQQVIGILSRLQNVAFLSPQQKADIVAELRKAVPSCPIVVQSNDGKKSSGHGK